MPRIIPKRRHSAFVAQSGLCCYCHRPMWLRRPARFARLHGLTASEAEQRRCTAEHLVAQCDGGRHGQKNIAAACLYCNARRHQLPDPPSAEDYRRYVQEELQAGRWLACT